MTEQEYQTELRIRLMKSVKVAEESALYKLLDKPYLKDLLKSATKAAYELGFTDGYAAYFHEKAN